MGKSGYPAFGQQVITHPVDKSGRVYFMGKDLFDSSQPIWHGKAPDVKWPE